jgi:hypothetical protein
MSLNAFLEFIHDSEGVELDRLEPLTTLIVRTRNSLYRLIVGNDGDVLVQGGSFFPEPTPARLDGASAGGSLLRRGWIGVGLLMEFRAGGQRITTSRVLGIAAERFSTSVVH